MRWTPALACALLAAAPAAAQSIPQPDLDNPRIQSLRWSGADEVWLTALPATGLTVLLDPGETIEHVSIAEREAMDVRVSVERNGLLIFPLRTGELGTLAVDTDRRSYRFSVRTGTDLLAAYLVRFDYGPPATPVAVVAPAAAMRGDTEFGYRLRGDRSVAPARIVDDGARTYIEFAPEAPLPAIFAIGPNGEEQLINGYMRGAVFVIDRVWNELVFRIDRAKANARRLAQPDNRDG